MGLCCTTHAKGQGLARWWYDFFFLVFFLLFLFLSFFIYFFLSFFILLQFSGMEWDCGDGRSTVNYLDALRLLEPHLRTTHPGERERDERMAKFSEGHVRIHESNGIRLARMILNQWDEIWLILHIRSVLNVRETTRSLETDAVSESYLRPPLS